VPGQQAALAGISRLRIEDAARARTSFFVILQMRRQQNNTMKNHDQQ
jgi:hypothetical protein